MFKAKPWLEALQIIYRVKQKLRTRKVIREVTLPTMEWGCLQLSKAGIELDIMKSTSTRVHI